MDYESIYIFYMMDFHALSFKNMAIARKFVITSSKYYVTRICDSGNIVKNTSLICAIINLHFLIP